MNDESKSSIALAERFLDAIENGDIDTISNCYSKNSITWHNSDEKEQGLDEQLAALKGFFVGVPKRKYVSRKYTTYPGGMVMQLEFNGELANGRSIRFLPCIICVIEDGRIARIDEYFDPSPFTAG